MSTSLRGLGKSLKKSPKKLGANLKSALDKFKTNKVATYIAVLIIGILGGYSLRSFTADASGSGSSSESGKSRSSKVSSKDRANNRGSNLEDSDNSRDSFSSISPAERLDRNYDRVKELVSRDKDNKRLNEDQANKLNAKLEEIYNYLKGIDTQSEEGRKTVREKRNEWRQWAKDNDLSSRYVTRMP